ncbi:MULTISPECIES: hypothetical protein [Klebsiella/Raoultella group]|uniref:hypothetical protein n=1 Tax=Klebsiella/Raoultella group TaxID=2890311 RepID=UPI0003AC9679|nr:MULTISPECIES: hypothetical protein [Klebsiella/Raoultella group]HDT5235383.1 hypothetical protein [Klebsiella pneumoniae subsp. pneumoniae]EXF39700.1 hypothetical protein N035_014325 [Klebsiella pneumoniae EGD-HP19-C]MCF2279137.1 hypothetical protein [Klebsiella pneumoniae]MCF2284529.1 hypothetical protein [Klebsiella pneumoniae]MCF6683159.1 hypothetical protein [Raoultella ornithinolytica]
MRVVQLVIYGFWGICLFAAAMGKFGDFFTAGTGFWSVVMLFVAGLCQLLASIASIVWAFYGTGNLRAKYLPYKFVNNYTVPVLIIVLALVANAARSSSDEARAHKLGFKDGKEFATARENNITNVADYAKFAEEQRVKAAEKASQDAVLAAEKERQAKEEEAKCLDDAHCYASKHKAGDYICKVAVENSAQYQFKWTDGITEPKFSSYSWYDKSRKLVTLYGHRAQAQNGFGAFKNIEYSCTFNADTGEVLSTNLQ